MKLINFLKKGSSEALAFAYIAPLICFIIIEICSYVRFSTDIHNMTLALDAAGRGACICTNKDDAESLAQMVAESAVTSGTISDVQIDVDYATDDDVWQAGLLLKVTITAKINYMSMINGIFHGWKSEECSKSMIYSVEGRNFTKEELYIMAGVMEHESGTTSGMIAVGTALMNRVESPYYPNTVYEVIYQPNAIENVADVTSRANNPSQLSDEAIKCATSVLSGTRDSRLMTYPNFNVHNKGPCCSWYSDTASRVAADGTRFNAGTNLERVCIGGNGFHWQW